MQQVLDFAKSHGWIPLYLFANMLAIVIIPLGLPGIWLQFVSTLAITVFLPPHLGWFWTILILFMAAGGEVLDFVMSSLGLKTTNGSKFADWTSLICGFVFAFFGFLIPIPIPVLGMLIGSVIMSFIGTFSGAIIGEMVHQRQLSPAFRVATGAVVGRACGVAVKLWIAFLAFCVSLAGVTASLWK